MTTWRLSLTLWLVLAGTASAQYYDLGSRECRRRSDLVIVNNYGYDPYNYGGYGGYQPYAAAVPLYYHPPIDYGAAALYSPKMAPATYLNTPQWLRVARKQAARQHYGGQ